MQNIFYHNMTIYLRVIQRVFESYINVGKKNVDTSLTFYVNYIKQQTVKLVYDMFC